MDLNARVDVNCGRKDGRTDGRKTGRLYRTLLKQIYQWTYRPSGYFYHVRNHIVKVIDTTLLFQLDGKPDAYIAPC